MDSFEWNKVFMALGFAVLGLFGINEFSHLVFPEAESDRPPVTEASTGDGGTTAPEPADQPVDFGTLLAGADVEAGKSIARQCVQCHSWDNGGPNKIGPNLWDIVGAKHAHLDNFAYSSALKGFEGVWDYEGLYKFLKRPAGYVPGTKMVFAGLRRDTDRINLIAYMRTWSDNPKPLPEPLGSAQPEGPAPPGEPPAGDTPPPG